MSSYVCRKVEGKKNTTWLFTGLCEVYVNSQKKVEFHFEGFILLSFLLIWRRRERNSAMKATVKVNEKSETINKSVFFECSAFRTGRNRRFRTETFMSVKWIYYILWENFSAVKNVKMKLSERLSSPDFIHLSFAVRLMCFNIST